MKYLLDTNVLSELRKVGDGKADANVVAWASAQDVEDICLSASTILELERGMLSIQRRNIAQGARICSWLENYVRLEFAGRILSVDDAIATCCAHLYVPDRRNEADALIAATALVHGLIVVTRNLRDFEGTGVVVIDPWYV
ncbi:type II toxin-antitoxin system VapC family toxin [Rhizobium sp. P44RR-XXIV]|uniref:type II toxin-antitoxin system VapC family toxin n=1 Tax=Rhizobium sp. P44RR-XXIV TaxID=1921145 RepID=UPI0009874F4D|nr:type II toxin-antitoxin system VapC family toxin [Rhizobium sp. P44RR-XXIV]TIX90807.1 type II toxin-antitoxin system VapC family toxin [Rhizobium sp. P44RR-XXIV]